MSEVKKVYAAISAVMADMAKTGIQKNSRNQQQGYQFRGIDDVYNALAVLLSRHNLVALPRVLNREVADRQTAKGGTLFYVCLEVEFDFVSAEDGSCHTVKVFGEAMDSADKATNKAMSAAYKYACIQTFCIPTEGDNDADATTHTLAPATAAAPSITAAQAKALRDKLQAGGMDETAFCNAAKIDCLESLQAQRFASALSTIERKAKAAQGVAA